MELENEKRTEEQSAEQQNTSSREGSASQTSGYQGYKPGRSPRPRIHQPVRQVEGPAVQQHPLQSRILWFLFLCHNNRFFKM